MRIIRFEIELLKTVEFVAVVVDASLKADYKPDFWLRYYFSGFVVFVVVVVVIVLG